MYALCAVLEKAATPSTDGIMLDKALSFKNGSPQ
jgi:hypothetical protein